MGGYILIVGTIAGFLIAKFFAGNKEGEQGRLKSIKFDIKKFTIHLHHWLLGLMIIILLASLKFYNDLIHGLLAGVIIQGLTYKDFYKIIYRRKF